MMNRDEEIQEKTVERKLKEREKETEKTGIEEGIQGEVNELRIRPRSRFKWMSL